MAPVCTSSEINLLVYHYLKESGFSHACFSLRHEGRLDDDPLSKEAIIEPGRLIRVLQKGLLYLAVESHVNADGSEKPCSAPFRLVGAPHVCNDRLRSPLQEEPNGLGSRRATSLTPPAEPSASRVARRDAASQTALAPDSTALSNEEAAVASSSRAVLATSGGKRKGIEGVDPPPRPEREEKRLRRDDSTATNGKGKGKEDGAADDSMDADTSTEVAQDGPARTERFNGISSRDRTSTPEVASGPPGKKKKKKGVADGGKGNAKNASRSASTVIPEKGKDPGMRKFPKQKEDGKHFTSGDVKILAGHTGEVFVSAWNPTVPDLLASGAGDATVRIWDLSSGESPPKPDPATSPDEDPVAQAVTTKTICKHLPATHAKDVTTLDWNPDGTLLASGSYDGILRLWTPQGDLHLVMSMHQGPIFAVRWNRKGTQLLTASQDSTAIVWDLSSGKVRQQYALHSDSVLDVDWLSSPKANSGKEKVGDYMPSAALAMQDGIFATCSADNSINLLKLGEPKPIRTFKGHSDEVNAIAFDYSHTLLASASDDFSAKIWALDSSVTGMSSERSESPSGTRKRQSPDTNGQSRAGTGAAAMDVDASEGETKGSASKDSAEAGGSSPADLLAKGTKVSKGLRFTLKGHTRELYALAWAPSGPCTANQSEPRMLATSAFDHTARLWNADDGSCLRVITEHKDSVYSLAFSPDAKLLVTGGIDERIYISSISTGTVVKHFKASGAVMDVQWHSEAPSISSVTGHQKPNGLPPSPVKQEEGTSKAADKREVMVNGMYAGPSLSARLSIAQQNKVLCVLRLDDVAAASASAAVAEEA
ncbi:WD40 repeat-like protein [Tilletiaria anomala UBC 951]|uniref:WD40 repeat-like protein n=1 Tax=Tilletiaria anomala (strain ATCC 24038 / CBS 436.72 / UBC 951) TaxID=1037660 RepID=A0A066VJ63_TILAU|nr:WD40 repeat-like protein [Tilletiaria anomala UBC 951]KDN41526.1 WD40 repeat-like protein [Tilletiaria anomala UBC 951]